MASTGNVFPSTGANVDRGGATDWTSPGNAVSDNATDATVAVPSDYLVTSSYGFAITTDCVILGVTVRVEAGESGTGSSSYIPQLHSDTTPTLIGAAKSAVTVTGATKVISTSGGVADRWSADLTPAVVNSSGFGVTIWSTDTGNTLAVDFITIALEYTTIAPLIDGMASFRFSRNLTSRRLPLVLREELDQFTQTPSSSPDSIAAEPFVTRVLRSRVSMSAGWMAALTAQTQVAEVPAAAWFAPPMRRRRETEYRLIEEPELYWPYIAPEIAAILPPPKVIRFDFTRTMAVNPPLVVAPPATGPPELYPAWVSSQLGPTSQNRRLVQNPDAPVYPETPVSEPSTDACGADPFVTRILRSRRLLVSPPVLAIDAAPPGNSGSQGFPAWTQWQRKPVLHERTLLKTPHPAVYPQTPAVQGNQYPAFVGRVLARRKSRQGLLLSGGGAVAANPSLPPYPSWAQKTQLSRHDAPRKLLRAPAVLAVQAAAPPVVQVTAYTAPRVHRISFRTSLQSVPAVLHVGVAPPANSGQQGYPAWVRVQWRRKETDRKLLQAPVVPSFPATAVLPAFTAQPTIRRSDTHRTMQSSVAPPLRFAPTITEPVQSWIPPPLFRRHGWVTLREVPLLLERPVSTDRGYLVATIRVRSAMSAEITVDTALSDDVRIVAALNGAPSARPEE